MQLLQGQTLRDRIATSADPFSTQEILDLAIQIASGLEAAHNEGIVHRDIKPANVFLTNRGEAKILDFGLAKLAQVGDSEGALLKDTLAVQSTNLSLTLTGAAMGTAGYMSPEQIRGEKVDARTDLFSFGLLLYEMATRQQAFTGKTAAILHDSILNRTPAPARDVNPGLPAKLEVIIGRALEKDRGSRYQSAIEFRSDLERLREEATSPELGRQETSPSVPRISRRLLYVAGLLVLFLAAGIFWAAKRGPASSPPELKLTQLTQNSSEIPVRSAAISPDGKYLAYSDRDGIHVKALATNETRILPQPDSLRDTRLDWSVIAWFPDGNRFVVELGPYYERDAHGENGSTWVASAVGGAPRKIHDDSWAESISPDGSSIAFSRQLECSGAKEVWLMDAAGEHSRKFLEAEQDFLFSDLKWSPDGKRLAYLQSSCKPDKTWTVESRDFNGGPSVVILPDASAFQHFNTWLPDGRMIYAKAEPVGNGGVSIFGMDNPGGNGCNFWTVKIDTRTGRPAGPPPKITHWAGFCLDRSTATADGKRLVFTEPVEHRLIYVADLQRGGTRIMPPKPITFTEGLNVPFGWTSDSKAVIFLSNSTGDAGLYKQLLDSDTAERLLTGFGETDGWSVTPDGKWVLYISYRKPRDSSAGTIMRVSTNGGPAEPLMTGRFWDISCARFPSTLCVVAEESPGSGQITLSALDPAKGHGREFFRLDAVAPFAVSPDGTRVLLFNGGNPIRILSLADKSLHEVTVKGWNRMESIAWTGDSKGMYISGWKKGGAVLSYSDLSGNNHVIWEQRNGFTQHTIPSPDGQHLATQNWSLSSNVWMMENF